MADLSFLKPLLKERGIKIKEFCDVIGVTEQGFARLVKSNSTKIDTLELIAENLNLPMSVFFKDRRMEVDVIQNAQIQFMEVPFVPVYAQAGYMAGFGDDYVEHLPTMPIMVDRSYKGNYRIFEVKGDSMNDGSSQSLLNGDKIVCREVRREYWTSHLHIKDWYFVVVHKTEGVTVKQITDHDLETGIINCHPLNPIYDDFSVNLDDVIELYNVVALAAREVRL